MTQYIVKRMLLLVPTAILATMLVFTIMWVIPGDAAFAILVGDEGTFVDPKKLAELRQELGLDRPLYVQYGDWLWNTLRGDLGESTFSAVPVWNELQHRFPVTMELAILGIFLAFIVAVPLGPYRP